MGIIGRRNFEIVISIMNIFTISKKLFAWVNPFKLVFPKILQNFLWSSLCFHNHFCNFCDLIDYTVIQIYWILILLTLFLHYIGL